MASFSPVPRRMNYGRPTDIKFGPWPNGLVTNYVPELIDNASLAKCDNFDVLPTGQLQVRPGIRYNDNNTIAVGGFPYIGGAGHRAIVYDGNDLNVVDLSTQQVSTYHASSNGFVSLSWAVKYRGKFYMGGAATNMLSATDNTPSTFAKTTTGPATDTSGGHPTIFRDRLFVIGQAGGTLANTRVYYSRVTDPTNFTDPNDAGFFDMPDSVQAIAATRTSLYFFTANATYYFVYNSVPSDGRLELINPVIGANSAVSYNNHVYFAGNQGVYNLINNNLNDISKVLDLTDVNFETSFMYLLGKRFILPSGGFSYVYNLDSNRWSRYVNVPFGAIIQEDPLNNRSFIIDASNFYYDVYHDYSQYPDYDTSFQTQPITAEIITKDYDEGITSFDSYKRLYNVIVNLWSAGHATGNVVAAAGSYNANDLFNDGANLFPANYEIDSPTRYQTIKFFSSLRLQRFHYDVTVIDSGPAPVTLYLLSSLAKVKQPEQSATVGS